MAQILHLYRKTTTSDLTFSEFFLNKQRRWLLCKSVSHFTMGLNGSSYDCVITYYSSYTTHTTDTNFLPPLQMLQQVDISVTTLSLVHVCMFGLPLVWGTYENGSCFRSLCV